MKTKKIFKSLSIIISVLMIITALPLSAFGLDLSGWINTEANYGDEYQGANGYFEYGTYSYITYEPGGIIKGHTYEVNGTKNRYKLGIVNKDTNKWIQVMCIEAGKTYAYNTPNTSMAGESSEYWNRLPADVQKLIMLAVICGWSPGKTCPGQACINAGANEDDFSFATQIIIWEIQQQIRTGTALNDKEKVDLGGVHISANQYYDLLNGHPAALECYKWILSQMGQHKVIPSFMADNQSNARTITLEYNKAIGAYQATVTDTNNTLADIITQNMGSVTMIRNGNKYTFTSTKPISGTISAKFNKKLSENPGTFLVWNTNGHQTAVTGAYDPINLYVKFETNTLASLRIKKIDASGSNNVSGIMFNIEGNGTTQTVKTEANGTIDVSLEPGTYTITEQAMSGYIRQESQTVTLEPGDSKTVTFTNHKYITFDIIKIDNSGFNNIENVEFTVSDEEGNIVFTEKTDANGKISKKLAAGKYFVTETTVPGYKRQKTKAIVLSEDNPTASITFKNEASDIELKIIKIDDSGLNKVSGITFNVAGINLNENYITDANGVISVGLAPGIYTITEVTPNGFRDTAAQRVRLRLGDESKTVTFTNIPKKGSAYVKKTSEDGYVEGFTFNLRGTSVIGKAININATTDSNGIADFGEVLAGTYTITEVNTPDRYEQQPSKRVTIKDGDQKEIKFNNTLVKHGLKIYKTSEDDNISGIEFVIRGRSNGGTVVNITRTTDESGMIVEELQPGSYTVTETVPVGYEPQESVVVNLTDQDAEVRFNNVITPTPLKIKKVDLSGNNNISNIPFVIVKTDGYDVYSLYTDVNGEINVNLKPGIYRIAESVPFGYQDQSVQTVTIGYNDTAKEVTFYNDVKPVELEIIKEDISGFNNIAGIEFVITGPETNKTVITGSDGTITTKLKPGTYMVTETVPFGYKDVEQQRVTLNIGDTKKSVTFVNDVNLVPLKIVKIDTSGNNKVNNVGFVITGSDNYRKEVVTDNTGLIIENLKPGTYTIHEIPMEGWEPVDDLTVTLGIGGREKSVVFRNIESTGQIRIVKTSEDGFVEGVEFRVYGVSNAGTVVDETYITDENGVVLTDRIPVGTYSVEEIRVPNRYIDQNVKSVTVERNNPAFVTFDNTLKKGRLQIVKYADDNILEGHNFRITATTESGLTYEFEAVTDSQGLAVIENMPIGTYTVEEINVDQRYFAPLDQTVEIKWNLTSTVTFENEIKPSVAKIIKTSEDEKISNIVFEVTGTNVKGENVSFSLITNENGEASREIVPGRYTVFENVPLGYKPQNSITLDIAPDTEGVFSFYNELQRGSVRIIKASEDDVISGHKFRLYGQSITGENVDETGTTNDEGVVTFENIPTGDYNIEEINTPNKYIVPQSQSVTILPSETSTITFYNTLKKGNLRIVKTSEDDVVEGVEFKLSGITDTGRIIEIVQSTNNEGIVEFNDLQIGRYTVEEVNTPNRYIVTSSQNIEILYNDTVIAAFHNELKKGSIQIDKHDENGILEGHRFRITAILENGNEYVREGTTDASGKLYFLDLPIGEYSVEEIDAAEYYITPALQTTQVEWNVTSVVHFDNVLKTGNVSVKKSSEDGIISGVYFRLYGTADCGQQIELISVTDDEGVAAFNDIPVGNYYLEEFTFDNTPQRYVAIPAQNITVTYNETSNVTFENILKRGNIELVKVDSENTDVMLSGAEFTVYKWGDRDEEIGKMIETEPGHYVITDLPYGDYIVVETKSPIGYVNNNKQYGIRFGISVAENDNTYKITEDGNPYIVNKPIRGNIRITKVDEEYPDHKLTGAAFEVYNNDGTYVGTMDEVSVGIYEITELRYGKYIVKETESPEGFLLKDTEYAIEITEDGETYEINDTGFVGVYNTPIKGNVRITKVDEEYPDNKLSGAVFELYDSTGTLIDAIPETQEGVYEYTGLRYGKYTIREVISPEGFILNDKIYSFSVTENDYTYEINDNDFEGVANKPIKGSITVTKVDAEYPDHKLTGAEFTVYDKDHNTIGTMFEIEAGIYKIEGLRYGKYYIKETVSPEGFVLKDTEYEVFVSEDGYTYEIKDSGFEGVYNTPIKGNISLTKYDKDYPENKVVGAVFEVYDTDSNSVGIMNEIEDGYYEITGLRYGKYTVKEIEAPDGFVLRQTVYEVEICENDKTYEVEDIDFEGIYNEHQKGGIRIIKTSKDGKVYGFTFRIVGNDYDKTFTTDENGVIEIDDLIIGEYTISEIKDDISNDYILPSPKTVYVTYNQMIEIEMYNDKEQPNPYNPTTSDGRPIIATVLMLSAIGAAFIFEKQYRKRCLRNMNNV